MSNRKNLGVFPTMITPYLPDGSIDIATAEKYVEWYFSKGCSGIFAICQSSEIWKMNTEEKIYLSSAVYKKAKSLSKESGREFTVVCSGHTSETIEDQAKELNAVYNAGADALIWITNRLDINNEGDDVWIENAEKLLKAGGEEAAGHRGQSGGTLLRLHLRRYHLGTGPHHQRPDRGFQPEQQPGQQSV